MKREYHKWFSTSLRKNMELLIFGHGGVSVLFFPTRMARFYDYENWKVIEALRPRIEAGELQVYCVDSIDQESFYNLNIPPRERIRRHIQYEGYIVNEVIPFIDEINTGSSVISAGCSMGAYHAVNLAFKHPQLFCKVVGMSGRYDVSQPIKMFRDLLDGYHNEDIYFNMPNQYISNLYDEALINQIRKLDIIIAVGEEDAFLDDNRYLSSELSKKGINNSLYIWNEEAHRPKYWRHMVQLYF
ncbi:esterase family protein [Mucilaginibacter gynuensis]|uniref:Esterase family protein n=1 Tax=Mucilaginibacter gynuensis TaxID=1302236 RepID=A0ABP8G2A0_9SPHI